MDSEEPRLGHAGEDIWFRDAGCSSDGGGGGLVQRSGEGFFEGEEGDVDGCVFGLAVAAGRVDAGVGGGDAALGVQLLARWGAAGGSGVGGARGGDVGAGSGGGQALAEKRGVHRGGLGEGEAGGFEQTVGAFGLFGGGEEEAWVDVLAVPVFEGGGGLEGSLLGCGDWGGRGFDHV